MDPRIAIWNILHDGEITAVSEEVGTLTMFVSIPYLRRRLAPLGDSFVLTLERVKRAEFKDCDGRSVTLTEELENSTLEILSTDSERMPVCIETTSGRLILDFEGIRLAMDTGQNVAHEMIERACEEYWAEWEAKAEPDSAANGSQPIRSGTNRTSSAAGSRR
jgi:hypothetical protein